MQRVLDLAARIERSPQDGRRLLAEFAARWQFPLMDDNDNATFFYWDGHPADAIFLQHWVFGLPSRQEFRRIGATDAFYLPLALPRGARVEYKFEVVRGENGRWMHDPRNGRRAFDPFGSNSVCPAGSYVDPEWCRHDPYARSGSMETHRFFSNVWGDEREYKIYRPSEARPGKEYPLLIVHDGGEFLHYAEMKTLLDNLIHRHEVAPLIVCFTNGVRRNWEYAANPKQADFLRYDLLAHLTATQPVLDEPQFRGIMGASFGAVSSLYAAVRHPGVWGRLLLQSGSFAFTDIGEHTRGPMWDPIVGFVNNLRESPPPIDAQVYLSCGTFESLIYYNRSLVPVFQRVAQGVRFSEVPDGHNWINWRDRLREALTWLFPGPLWMYYE